ncbi:hypothetical protein GCM10027614_02740 [Micromonospora vulcania]
MHLGVHRVRPLGRGTLHAATHDPVELLVLGHLPLHVDGTVGHTREPVDGERVRCQAGPEHDAVRRRIAGRDTELERVARQGDVVVRAAGARRGGLGREDRRTRGDPAKCEEVTTRQRQGDFDMK